MAIVEYRGLEAAFVTFWPRCKAFFLDMHTVIPMPALEMSPESGSHCESGVAGADWAFNRGQMGGKGDSV
jgi:hypothetical protein